MPETRPQPAWFCLRSQPKHEHIAARQLRSAGVEIFLPRIRFKRATRAGTAWATEALFPNYLFARFDWAAQSRLVRHSPGVSGIVHFGDHWPTIPDESIADLRELFGAKELHLVPAEAAVGDTVQITGGAFHGLLAVVTQVMPARDRVAVLLDFLGRQTAVELPQERVVKEGDARRSV